jgi:hypothetical protein
MCGTGAYSSQRWKSGFADRAASGSMQRIHKGSGKTGTIDQYHGAAEGKISVKKSEIRNRKWKFEIRIGKLRIAELGHGY